MQLSGEEKTRLAIQSLYQRGRYYWNKRTAEGLKRAIECFNLVLEKDPRHARAYAGLANCYDLMNIYGGASPEESFPQAKAAAEKALSLDEGLAEAHTALFDGYSQSLTNRFVFGPVEAATLAKPSDVLFGCETDCRVTLVPNAFNIIIYCRALRTKMRFTDEPVQRDRLDLACTTFYEYGKLLDWFPTMDFHPVWQYSNGSLGLFLLKRG